VAMLVCKLSLQNLIKLGKDVSIFAYQSPPPLYFKIPILKELDVLLNDTNRAVRLSNMAAKNSFLIIIYTWFCNNL
jgi:hypothetical protein